MLYFTPGVVQLQGPSPAATWRVAFDFSAHGDGRLDRIWLTLTPPAAIRRRHAPPPKRPFHAPA
jgi:hypothetical protein